MKNQIDLLKWMLDDVRQVTISGVSHLSKDQLIEKPANNKYPLGSYLMHLAECEIFWLEVLSGIEQSGELKERAFYNKWYDPSESPEQPNEPLDFSVYKDVMDEARNNFIDHISGMDDSELDEEVTFKGGNSESKFKKKWIIYHIIEHEAHHRGQMFMLIRQAGWNKNKS